MSRAEELTEEQWTVIEHLFPELQPREDARGRPPADTRAVLSGVAIGSREDQLCARERGQILRAFLSVSFGELGEGCRVGAVGGGDAAERTARVRGGVEQAAGGIGPKVGVDHH